MQNSLISTRINSLYGSPSSSVDFDCKTATFGPEQQVSISPRHPLSFYACKTVWLAPELLVSMGPSPQLWFLDAKQRLLDQHTSLYGFQTSPVVLCVQNSVISTWINSLNVSMPTSVVFGMQNSAFWTSYKSLYGCQTSPVGLCMQTAWLSPELLVSMDSSPHLWFCAFKTATLRLNCMCLCMGPRPHLLSSACKQRA